MPTRTDPETPRYDATVPPSVKNVFDRDPLLIPQLFDDGRQPWYRRRSAITLTVVALLCLAGLAYALGTHGLAGTAQRAASVATAVLRSFARISG